jgi:hypothetical protein
LLFSAPKMHAETLLINQCGSDIVVMEHGNSSHSRFVPSGYRMMVSLPATVYGNFTPFQLSGDERQVLAAKGHGDSPVYFSTRNALEVTQKSDSSAKTNIVSYPPTHQSFILRFVPKTLSILVIGFLVLVFLILLFIVLVIVVAVIYKLSK